jgi:hypothetical protein
MNRSFHAGFTLTCILSAQMAVAAGVEPNSVIVCRSPASIREIRTYHTGNAACHVDYFKDGATRTLWSASSDRAYCEARATALATKLARGNYKCSADGAASVDAPSQPAEPAKALAAPDLNETQIVAANQWLQLRVESLAKSQPIRSGPEAKRYSQKPDFLAPADLDADGKTDLAIAWSWSSFRCDGSYLTVLINDGTDAKPTYRPAEVQLPSNCGAKGWLPAVKEIKDRRIYLDLQQRYPGSNNVQRISATLRHDGTFTFFGTDGRPGSLASIEKALPMKYE